MHELDPLAGPVPPAGSTFADAVAAVGAAAAAARRRLDVGTGGGVWQVAAAASSGRLLAPAPPMEAINTSWPWAAAP